jgi:hypothetical protein
MARAEKRKYHYIYKITCKITNRFYIGMHSTDNLDDGYFGSGKRLWFSINYHGKENHNKEILEFLPSRQALKEREKEIVNKKLLGEDLCMNLCVGGEGGRGFTNEEQKLNAKKSNEKQKNLRETNQEWFEKRNKNISIGNKKLYETGQRERKVFYDWSGLNHSKETKNKIGEKNKETQKGEKNSQFGTCWITKDGLNKKIKKEELENFTQNGWIKGRIQGKK